MAVKTKDELLTQIKAKLNDTDDETLTLIEDVTDTINNYESKGSDNTDWKKKFEENDAAWRQKYKDRFFNSSVPEEIEEKEEVPESIKPLTFESLFKEG